MQIDVGNLPTLLWYEPAGKLVELAQLADRMGVDRFAISDLRFQSDCLTLMTACAVSTKRLKVESLVTDVFVRHPTLTAATIATIADLSGGRVVLGLGGGVEQPSYWGEDRSKPLTALREGVEVIRRMWRGETVNFEGKVIQCHGAKLRFEVRHKIPILIAARGPKAVELSGEIADIVHLASLFNNREHYIDNLAHVKTGLEKGGRSLRNTEVDLSISSCISEDGERAIESSKQHTAIGILWTAGMDKYAQQRKDWKVPPQFSVPDRIVQALSKWNFWDFVPLPEELGSMLGTDIVNQFTVSGTPKQVAERLEELSEYPNIGGIRIYSIPVKGRPVLDGYLETFKGLGKALKLFRGKGGRRQRVARRRR